MKFIKMFLALVGLAVLFVFVRDNTGKVVVTFWDYATPEIELFLILIITFVLGMIAVSFGSTLKIIQLKRQLKSAGNADVSQKKSVQKAKKGKDKSCGSEQTPVNSEVKRDQVEEFAAVATAASAATSGIDVEVKQPSTSKPTTQGAVMQDAVETEDMQLRKSAPTLVQTVEESAVEAVEDENSSAVSDKVISLPADEQNVDEIDRK